MRGGALDTCHGGEERRGNQILRIKHIEEEGRCEKIALHDKHIEAVNEIFSWWSKHGDFIWVLYLNLTRRSICAEGSCERIPKVSSKTEDKRLDSFTLWWKIILVCCPFFWRGFIFMVHKNTRPVRERDQRDDISSSRILIRLPNRSLGLWNYRDDASLSKGYQEGWRAYGGARIFSLQTEGGVGWISGDRELGVVLNYHSMRFTVVDWEAEMFRDFANKLVRAAILGQSWVE